MIEGIVIGLIAAQVLRVGLYQLAYRRRKRGRVNVRDFGAIGDGVTNDTAAFHAANEVAGREGKITYVPPGNYLIGGKVRRHR